MRFIISFTVLSFVLDIGLTESSKESQGDVTRASIKPGASAPNALEMYHVLNALWFNNPLVQTHLSPGDVDGSRRVPFRNRHSIPKLAKSLGHGMDPFFSLGVFEPFERRPKPITLVAFRKNGYFPRRYAAFSASSNSMEVAELQSPYNDISSFWKDHPTDS